MKKFFTSLFKFFRRLTKALFSRAIIVGLSIILQIVWIWILLEVLTGFNVLFHVVFTVALGIILVLIIINKDEVAEYKLPWLVVSVTFPLLGGVLYAFFGNTQPSLLLKRRYKRAAAQFELLAEQNKDTLQALKGENATACAQAQYIYDGCKSPVYANTVTRYFPMGEDMFPVLIKELKKAKKFIFLEYFIIEEGKFFNAVLDVLKKKVEEGVEVRLLYDDMGSIGKVPVGYAKKLKKYGIDVKVFRPFLPVVSTIHNNRDHRKITVIDNFVAFTGGINLADEYINKKIRFGTWKDTGVMLKGDCVADFTLMFLTMWDIQTGKVSDYQKYASFRLEEGGMPEKERGYVACFGDGPKPFYDQQVGKNIYLNILNSATEYVYVTTPYLICDNELLSAIRLAARRGVDVRLITPHIPDKKIIHLITRSNYSTLIEAGVKIYEYTPGFIHAKGFLSDDKYAVVSTVNLDYRSLVHHFECGVWLYDTPTVKKIKNDMVKTLSQSREITAEEARLNLMQNLVKSVVQIITPLL